MMKKILTISALSLLSLSSAFAEGKGNADWAEEAALRYEQLAAEATANGHADQASIYARMSIIKREAGAAAAAGVDFSWDEYHQLNGKLQKLKHGGKGAGHKGKGGKEKGKPHAGFIDAAKHYEQKAAAAAAAGNEADAKIFRKLAAIKRSAAAGENVNWEEYHQLREKLSGNGQKKHKKHPRKHGEKKGDKKPGAGFLKAAVEYEAKANQAMQDGNEHNAEIYTKLAGIKRSAAAAAVKGEGFKWTEYFELKKQLK